MQTIPNDVLVEINKTETHPVRLFEIGGSPTLYYTDADIDVFHAGRVWASRGISYSEVSNKLGFETSSYELVTDNYDSSMTAWALTAEQRGYKTVIRKGFSAGAKNVSGQLTLISDYSLLLFTGETVQITVDAEATITATSRLDLHEANVKATQQVTCRFRFKDRNCGYSGSETNCDLTFARCTALANSVRFGGFPRLNSRYDA